MLFRAPCRRFANIGRIKSPLGGIFYFQLVRYQRKMGVLLLRRRVRLNWLGTGVRIRRRVFRNVCPVIFRWVGGTPFLGDNNRSRRLFPGLCRWSPGERRSAAITKERLIIHGRSTTRGTERWRGFSPCWYLFTAAVAKGGEFIGDNGPAGGADRVPLFRVLGILQAAPGAESRLFIGSRTAAAPADRQGSLWFIPDVPPAEIAKK